MRIRWEECPRGDVESRNAGFYVSLNPEGKFALNRATFKRMGEPDAVNILFDRVNNRIGLKPTSRVMRNAYRVTNRNGRGQCAIYGYRLLQEHGIDLPATVRFYDADIDNDGILVLDLRTARVPPNVLCHQKRKDRARSAATGKGIC